MSSDDARIVQLAAAGLVASGLLVTAGATALFPLRTSIGAITRENPVPWGPRDLGGGGSPGSSPIYGAIWSFIYAGEFVFAVSLLVAAAQGRISSDSRRLFVHAACVFSALLVSSLWSPLFAERKRWCFLMASVVLVFTAVVAMMGAVVAKPFFDDEEWFESIGGAVTSVFAGWTTVAAALSIGIVTRVYNRGLDKGASNEDESSFFPLVLSVLLAVIAIVFANPILPVPLFVALFFVKGIAFKDGRVWGASIVCMAGIVVAVVILYVYRSAGEFW